MSEMHLGQPVFIDNAWGFIYKETNKKYKNSSNQKTPDISIKTN